LGIFKARNQISYQEVYDKKSGANAFKANTIKVANAENNMTVIKAVEAYLLS
jgi:hypothetical protein